MISHERIEEIQGQAYVCAPSLLDDIARIYPLTMTEILTMGQIKYNKMLGLLLLTEIDIQNLIKEKIQEEIPLEKIQPLTFLLQSAEQNDGFFLELKEAFSTFLKEDIFEDKQHRQNIHNGREFFFLSAAKHMQEHVGYNPNRNPF